MEQTRLTLFRGLDKEKYEHKVVCTWAGGPMAKAIESEGVEITQVGSFKHPFEMKKHLKVLQVIRKFRPHIIHGGVFEGMTMATFGGLFGRVPSVILEETSDPQNRSRKANFLLKIYSRFADKVQAISPEVGQYLAEITKISQKKIEVITNGVPLPIISDDVKILAAKKQYGIRKEDFVVGFVGRLFNDQKRVSDLVEAVSMLEIPNIRLLIVGEGKDKDFLLDLIKEFRLIDKIHFVGYQSDPHLFYDLMDVLCVPSSREGFGLVAVEGMLHRLPIIATKVGGLQKVVAHNETGFIISFGSPREISEKINLLYFSPTLRKAMGDMGYQRALKEFSSERYVREVEQMYQNVMGGRIVH
ncbi:MAG: glycosyltransferase family 4 protein [Anditalea sp.]